MLQIQYAAVLLAKKFGTLKYPGIIRLKILFIIAAVEFFLF